MILWVLNAYKDTYIYKGKAEEIRQAHRGDDNVRTEAETGMIWPQAQECCPPHDEKNKKWILW